jgi:FkbM family methyltransferase
MARGLLRGPLRTIARRYPLLIGSSSLVQCQPFRRLIPAEDVVVADLRDGGKLLVKSHDFIGRSILLTGDYDPKITRVCRTVLRRGDTMVDVGANLGVVSAYAARIVGPTGAVHAFEPQQDLAALIKRSMAINGYDHVTVHPVALSDSTRSAPLYGSESSRATAALDGSGPSFGTVSVCHAGDTLSRLEMPTIRLLKVDVEGHEAPFIRGAMGYLRQNTPDVVVFESLGDEPFRQREVVRLLRDLGYTFFQIPKALVSMRLRPVTGDETSRGFDFVAARPGSGSTD